jgi:hypothetical protein
MSDAVRDNQEGDSGLVPTSTTEAARPSASSPSPRPPVTEPPQSVLDALRGLPPTTAEWSPENGLCTWPGSSLDWSSPREEVLLYIELPYFLMVEEYACEVTHGDASVKVEVVHGCTEVQTSFTNHKNHDNTIFVTRPGETEPRPVQEAVESSRSGFSARDHRTTLVITTSVHADVLTAIDEPARRENDARTYLTALMVGHLPVVNKLIGAYRRAAYDPFALDVTESTVPFGFVRQRDRFHRVSAQPYANIERRDAFLARGGRPMLIEFATPDECWEKLAAEETPGEYDLLDGWAHFFVGRFGDSIRCLVSAIEVLLESLITKALRERNKTDEEIRKVLEATAMSFQVRLDEYLALSKRTLPGPILSWHPEVTGTYLRDELNVTRRTRHRVVHHGHRMDPHMHGSMLKAVETMTWLYSWLEMNDRNWYLRMRLHQFKYDLRGRPQFDVAYTKQGVEVLPRQDPRSPHPSDVSDQFIHSVQWRSVESSLCGAQAGPALFVKAALACAVDNNMDIQQVFLHADKRRLVVDHDDKGLAPGAMSERFRCVIDDVSMHVFLLDLDGLPAAADLQGVLLRMLQLRTEAAAATPAEGAKALRLHGVVVVNHQRYLEPGRRRVFREIEKDLASVVAAYGLTLVFTTDLWRYMNGALEHCWSLKSLREGLIGPGFLPCHPPRMDALGDVIKYFPKLPGVYGVRLHPKKVMRQNTILYLQSERGYTVRTAASIEIGKRAVESARGAEGETPTDVAVKFEPADPRLHEGAGVFMPSD